jgi:peptidoglycan/LPS O-acetylase OafA/YrhL
VVAVVYPRSQPRDGESWLRAVTLTNFLKPDGLRPAMDHVWSMGTEFSWYIALPVIGGGLAVVARRLLPLRSQLVMYAVVCASALVTTAWTIWIDREVDGLSGKLTYPMWLPAFLICFMAGAMVKHLELTRSLGTGGGWLLKVAGRQWLVFALAALAVAVLVSPLSGPAGYVPLTFGESNVRFVAGFGLALILLMGLSAKSASSRLNTWMSARWLVATGRWSYGVYLWHLPVTVLLFENVGVQPGPMGFVVWIAVVAAVSLSLGALTYAWVEKPAIAWSKK